MGAYFGALIVAFVIYFAADSVISAINANTGAIKEAGKALQHCPKE